MANTILSSALSSPSLSIVSSSGTANIAASLGVSKVALKLRSKIFRHKTETGNTIVDARIVEPMQCEIDVFAPTLDAVSAINDVMQDRSSVYTIKSRGLVLTQMMMQHNEIKQTGDMISASPVKLQFKQLLTQNSTSIGTPTVAQPADSTVIDKGLQTISSAVQTAQGLASTVASSIGSAVSNAANTIGL